VLVDRNPLDAERIDGSARIAWLLRTARLTSPVTRDLPQYAMVERLRALGLEVSRSWVHRLEGGELRSGRGAEAYEQVLELPPGSLRSAIDLVCRSVPTRPPDNDPGEPVHDVERLSALTAAVLEAEPTGWDWLLWARQFSRPDVRGLRVSIARQLLTRLCSELVRAVGTAYDSRYEALAAIRSGPYGKVALEQARRLLDEEHVQASLDVVAAVTEHGDESAVAFCLELLESDVAELVRAGVHGLENLVAVTASGRLDPARLAKAALSAYNRSAQGSTAWRATAHLLRLLGARGVRVHGVNKPLPPTPARRPGQGSDRPSDRHSDRHWDRCRELADAITDEVGLPAEPMLARLLYDVLVSWSEWKSFPSARLLSALPFAEVVLHRVAELVAVEPDEAFRAQMLRRLPALAGPQAPRDVTGWLQLPDLRATALVLLAHGGQQPAVDVLEELLVGDADEVRQALYAAGMTAHPVLKELRDDPQRPAAVRGGADWWLRAGSRVVD
jgi:hypothetical protein